MANYFFSYNFRMKKKICLDFIVKLHTLFPRSHDLFYIASNYMNIKHTVVIRENENSICKFRVNNVLKAGADGVTQDPEDQDPQDLPLDIGHQVRKENYVFLNCMSIQNQMNMRKGEGSFFVCKRKGW